MDDNDQLWEIAGLTGVATSEENYNAAVSKAKRGKKGSGISLIDQMWESYKDKDDSNPHKQLLQKLRKDGNENMRKNANNALYYRAGQAKKKVKGKPWAKGPATSSAIANHTASSAIANHTASSAAVKLAEIFGSLVPGGDDVLDDAEILRRGHQKLRRPLIFLLNKYATGGEDDAISDLSGVLQHSYEEPEYSTLFVTIYDQCSMDYIDSVTEDQMATNCGNAYRLWKKGKENAEKKEGEKRDQTELREYDALKKKCVNQVFEGKTANADNNQNADNNNSNNASMETLSAIYENTEQLKRGQAILTGGRKVRPPPQTPRASDVEPVSLADRLATDTPTNSPQRRDDDSTQQDHTLDQQGFTFDANLMETLFAEEKQSKSPKNSKQKLAMATVQGYIDNLPSVCIANDKEKAKALLKMSLSLENSFTLGKSRLMVKDATSSMVCILWNDMDTKEDEDEIIDNYLMPAIGFKFAWRFTMSLKLENEENRRLPQVAILLASKNLNDGGEMHGMILGVASELEGIQTVEISHESSSKDCEGQSPEWIADHNDIGEVLKQLKSKGCMNISFKNVMFNDLLCQALSRSPLPSMAFKRCEFLDGGTWLSFPESEEGVEGDIAVKFVGMQVPLTFITKGARDGVLSLISFVSINNKRDDIVKNAKHIFELEGWDFEEDGKLKFEDWTGQKKLHINSDSIIGEIKSLVAEEAAEEPAAEEPAAEEPAAEEPAAQEPAAQEPAAEEPAAQEPGAQEPAAQEPAAQETGLRRSARLKNKYGH